MKRGDLYAVGVGLFFAIITVGSCVTADQRAIRDDLRAADADRAAMRSEAAADRARIQAEAAADRAAIRSEVAAVLRALVERVTRLESTQQQCSDATR